MKILRPGVHLPIWHREERHRDGGHRWTPGPATAGNPLPELAPRPAGEGSCSELQEKGKDPGHLCQPAQGLTLPPSLLRR